MRNIYLSLILMNLFFLQGCVLDSRVFTSSLKAELSSTPGPGSAPGSAPLPPLVSFPVDLQTPLFQDDFNRSNENLTVNIKWTTFQGGSSNITNQSLNSTDNGGGIYAAPSNPAVFPDLTKVYLESSLKMSGVGTQQQIMLPYADSALNQYYGCFFKYDSGSLSIYAGDFMTYFTTGLTPFVTLPNFSVSATNYVGCEVDQTLGQATVFLNSAQIGQATGLAVPLAANSEPVIVSFGNGIITDNVKAFPSFLDGRTPNSGDVRIFNAPYSQYYTSDLSTYSLQGYCSQNGSTIQVKDSAPGGFQSSIATCTNNLFSVTLDMSDLTRFPVGANQIRIEYDNAGSISEYFWNFYRLSDPIAVTISVPSPITGNDTTEFVWTVTYTGATAITLSPADVTLAGATANCSVSISGSGSVSRQVKVTGCTATTGNVTISIAADTASNSTSGALAEAKGPSGAVTLVGRPTVTIGSPSPVSGTKDTNFTWLITYAGASTVTLAPSDVSLSGSTTGCVVSVLGAGLVNRQVNVTGCLTVSGTVAITIQAGTASNTNGDSTSAEGPSTAVSVSNILEVNFADSGDVVDEGNAVNAQQMFLTLSAASPVDVTVQYSVAPYFSTAVNPTNYNLSSVGSVVIPAGQTSWPISYNYQGNATAGGVKLIQAGISKVSASGVTSVIGANQIKRRAIADEESSYDFQLSSGGNSSCTVSNLGLVKCWGENSYGQLGNGTSATSSVPLPISGGETYSMVSVGAYHACGVTTIGSVKCWGYNFWGQLGDGTQTSSTIPVVVSGGDTYTMVSAGSVHTCGLTTLGAIKCWGHNGSGQLGNNTITDSTVPVTISGADIYSMLSAGSGHTCGLTSGIVKCWGYNYYGELGDGTVNYRLVPAAVSGADSYSMVSAGGGSTCAVTTLGTLKCWGGNGFGKLGDGTVVDKLVPTAVVGSDAYTSVQIGGFQACAVTTLGFVKCWGYNMNGALGVSDTAVTVHVPTAIIGSRTYSAVSVGTYFSCGITTNGVSMCWGNNGYGQLGDGIVSDFSSVPLAMAANETYTQITTGLSGPCAITLDGIAKCWGDPEYGAIGDGTFSKRSIATAVFGSDNYTMVSRGIYTTCGVTTSGIAKCWGALTYGQPGGDGATNIPTSVSGGDTYTMVSAGFNHSCGVTSGGVAKCWGSNFVGQLGDGTTNTSNTPVTVSGGDTYVMVSTKWSSHSCGLTSGGVVKCWGRNTYGQLGDGTTTDSNVPVAVVGGDTYTMVSVGANSSCGVTSLGTIKCWGINLSGQLGDGTTTDSNVPVAVVGGDTYTRVSIDNSHTCGVTTLGAVKCWGNNTYGQLGEGTQTNRLVPTAISGADIYSEISSSDGYTCGITGGKIKCWGRKNYLGLGEVLNSQPRPIAY